MSRISKHTPIIGTKYRDWEVISSDTFKVHKNRAFYWKVRCKCGYEALRPVQHLVNLKVSHCKSCAKRELPFEQTYLNRIKYRALKSKFDFDLTKEYIVDLINKQDFKCALSNLPIEIRKLWHGNITQTASLDRIDNTKGYIIGNVQWLHKDINFMKGVLTQEKFIGLCKLISSKCG